MKPVYPGAVALLVALGFVAAHAQGYQTDTGGSALGTPINVPPPPAVAAVPAQPLMPRLVTPAAPPAASPAAPPAAPQSPQFGPPGGAVPILGPGPATPIEQGAPQPAAPQPAAPQPAAPQPAAPRTAPQTTGSGATGNQPGQPIPPPPNTWLPRQNAVLGVLDKEDGAVSRVAVQVGNSVVQGRLRVRVLACLVRPPDQPQDAAVFLSVENNEQTQDDAATAPQKASAGPTLFSGWLLRAEPGASAVSDARDTFRLISCGKG